MVQPTVIPANLGSRSFDIGVVEANKINVKVDTSLRLTANGVSAHLALFVPIATSAIPLTAQLVSVNNGATGITLTLPTGAQIGQGIYIKRRSSASTGGITINGGGSQVESATGTLGATTTLGTTAATRRAKFVWNGTFWERVIG